jgi:hypothetical protein
MKRTAMVRVEDTACQFGASGFAKSAPSHYDHRFVKLALLFNINVDPKMKTISHAVSVTLLACGLATGAAAQAQSQKISGDVIKLEASTLQIRAADSQLVAIKFGDNVRLSARSLADLDRIAPGTFLGTTAAPGADGVLVASEVHIFPESMRGTGEGHRPMDTGPGNTMTNATVSSVGAGKAATRPGNTMTNATVAQVARGEPERRLTLTYPGGEKVVIVPANTPIVMVEPADRSLITPGAHVVVYATKLADGSLAADRVTIGKNGFVPPL